MRKSVRYFIAWLLAIVFWATIEALLTVFFGVSGWAWNLLGSALAIMTVVLYAYRNGDFKDE